jgi:hypothetical protein
VERTHRQQYKTEPFEGATELLEALAGAGYQIIIASHRQAGNGIRLARWLDKYLPNIWSGMYSGPDKIFLIDKGDLVIDDSPHTIDEALKIGAEVWTLRWPWNRETKARKFLSLKTMSKAVRGDDDFNEIEFFDERDIEEKE